MSAASAASTRATPVPDTALMLIKVKEALMAKELADKMTENAK